MSVGTELLNSILLAESAAKGLRDVFCETRGSLSFTSSMTVVTHSVATLSGESVANTDVAVEKLRIMAHEFIAMITDQERRRDLTRLNWYSRNVKPRDGWFGRYVKGQYVGYQNELTSSLYNSTAIVSITELRVIAMGLLLDQQGPRPLPIAVEIKPVMLSARQNDTVQVIRQRIMDPAYVADPIIYLGHDEICFATRAYAGPIPENDAMVLPNYLRNVVMLEGTIDFVTVIDGIEFVNDQNHPILPIDPGDHSISGCVGNNDHFPIGTGALFTFRFGGNLTVHHGQAGGNARAYALRFKGKFGIDPCLQGDVLTFENFPDQRIPWDHGLSRHIHVASVALSSCNNNVFPRIAANFLQYIRETMNAVQLGWGDNVQFNGSISTPSLIIADIMRTAPPNPPLLNGVTRAQVIKDVCVMLTMIAVFSRFY